MKKLLLLSTILVGVLGFSITANAEDVIVDPAQATTESVATTENYVDTDIELFNVDDGGNVSMSSGELNEQDAGSLVQRVTNKFFKGIPMISQMLIILLICAFLISAFCFGLSFIFFPHFKGRFFGAMVIIVVTASIIYFAPSIFKIVINWLK